MNKTTEDLVRGAAFHEAGHVIVAQYLGLPAADIKINDDGSGYSQIGPSDHLPLIDQVALCVAGIEAQELFECKTVPLAAAADYTKVASLVNGLTEAESLEIRSAGYLRALAILKSRRLELEELAHYLIEHRHVSR